MSNDRLPLAAMTVELGDEHYSWRLWSARRDDIRMIVGHAYPFVDKRVLFFLLSKIEFLQCATDATFERYLRDAVADGARRSEI